ncbi:MAG: putative ATP-dependent helicase DinG [Turneriella sp.]|nr:putative ATP-dependent helicase DinG [Turneriella sp.]
MLLTRQRVGKEIKDELDEILQGRIPPWCDLSRLSGIQGEAIEVALSEHTLSDKTLNAICSMAFEKIGKELLSYQTRDAQVQMAQQILRSFYRERSVVIEAATGVGKSFAYTVASLAFSHLTGVRVLLTTETKALQWQLFEKDLPFIQSVLDKNLRFELCLGSANYFCRLRYEQMLHEGLHRDIIDNATVGIVRAWANEVITDDARSGSRFDNAPKLPETIWSLITRDSEGCPAARCEYYSTCNYYRERRKWAEAQLLVANHHLLLYHLLNDKFTLPEYGALVIDEAHGLIKTGFNIFTASFARHNAADLKKSIDKTLAMHTGLKGEAVHELGELVEVCVSRWETFFSQWEVETDMTFTETGTNLIRKNLANAPDLETPFTALREKFEEMREEELEGTLLNSINAEFKAIRRMVDFIRLFSNFNSVQNVYWAEKKNERFFLHACRLNLGETLADLIPELRLYTSATLGYLPMGDFPTKKSELIQRGFFNRFLTDALPLAEEGSIDCNIFFSPFNYKEHAALYIPDHLLVPEFGASLPEQNKYFDALTQEIAALAQLSSGGALVLFTSNYHLSQITDRLREAIDLPVISQLEIGVQDALLKFRADKNSILLGSQSFWQGIDVAGDALRLLVITKLLFTPPDDPIFKARSENLETQGKKPFFELSLPHATTMLRQAFGRLIRSESDKGVVALLDSRIWKKAYGKTLISNLPRVNVVRTFSELERLNKEFKLLEFK